MAFAPLPRSSVRPEPATVIALLRRFLSGNIPPDAMTWLDQEVARQRSEPDEKRLVVALGLAARRIGRVVLPLSDADIADAQALRQGWQPQRWGADEAGRVAILLATYRGNDPMFAARLNLLCAQAEVTELIAFLKGFAVFPAAPELHDRAREGVRSAIKPVLEAIACHNPYPFDHFDADAWNQMVVKCVFTGAEIETISGLAERRNPELIQMLRDLVEERRVAGRPSPDAVHRYIAGAL
jgi:hypothetical protein